MSLEKQPNGSHEIIASCLDEKCGICLRRGVHKGATHKVEEVGTVANISQYVCCYHYGLIFGAHLYDRCYKSTEGIEDVTTDADNG